MTHYLIKAAGPALAIVSISEVLHLAIEDWFLWALLAFFITVDTVIASVQAWQHHRFEWRRLELYPVKLAGMVGGLMALSLFAAAFSGRADAEATAAFIRNWVAMAMILAVFGSLMNKVYPGFGKFLSEAIRRSGHNE